MLSGEVPRLISKKNQSVSEQLIQESRKGENYHYRVVIDNDGSIFSNFTVIS